jgi:hypothetical protein
MFGFIKNLFGTAPKAETTEVPYKVDAPMVDTADIALAQMPPGGAAVVEAPKAEAPKAEAPKAEAPKAEVTAKPKAPAKTKTPAKPKTSPASKKPRAPKKPKK